MDAIKITGGTPLKGNIRISGAKNAALPLMCAALLSDSPLTLGNVPDLADIRTLELLLAQHGTVIERFRDEGGNLALRLQCGEVASTTAPYDLVRRMRASVLVLGPLLARMGEARVSLPGGCAIGTRPVDLHLKALEALGAEITLSEGYIQAKAPSGLRGAKILFPKISVGATENLLMAASLAQGETVLMNAAREPEVCDLAECLVAMGVEISGIGTDTIRIQGRKSLNTAHHMIVPDRIETGTYAMAAAITGGEVTLSNTRPELLTAAIAILRQAGVSVEVSDTSMVVARHGVLKGVDVMTEPHPGFPTDLQAQFMGLMAVAEGASMITETIFENRFMHAPELMRMGANINVHHASALVRGVTTLKGAEVMATDLRASSSLILAGLAAEGETVIHRVYHLDRGYERLEAKLSACGAIISRIQPDDDKPVSEHQEAV